jgi:DNA-binding transcriptional ArsR family regulator
MSNRRRERKHAREAERALLFAALGDETRLALIAGLSAGHVRSISQLTDAAQRKSPGMTRQGVTKHLRVLERAGLLRWERHGRETQFTLNPQPFKEINAYLETISKQWEDALSRLKAFVEK